MRVSARRMGSLLGTWADGNGPLHQRLSTGLGRVIERGELPSEALLPTERELAVELGISRTTVVTAYRNLKRAGHLASRQGRGTWIPRSTSRPRAGAAAEITSELFGTMFSEGAEDTVDLTSACGLPNPVTTRHIGEIAGAALQAAVHGRGYLPGGLPALRQAIAERYTVEGLPSVPEQIVVTVGGQQAISLIVSLLVQADAAVLVEDPTYPGTLDILRARGARTIGVPIDADGIVPDALEAQAVRQRPALVYTVPSFHNPTGANLTPERAARIAGFSHRTGIPVLEDHVLRELWFQGRRPPPYLAALEPEAPILTAGSLSKTMWGGLRIGWIRAPRSFAERLTRARLLADLGGSVPAQALGLLLLERFDEAVAERRHFVRRNAELAEEMIPRLLPEWEFTPPGGGAALWLRLPWGDGRAFAQTAQRSGVLVLPGAVTSVSGGQADHIRVSLLSEPEELGAGLLRLAEAWAAYRQMSCAESVIV